LTLAKRLKGMGSVKYQRDGDPRTSGPGFGLTIHPDTLDAPLRWRKPRRVFVNSMSDLFHKDVPDEFIARVWAVMAATPQHTYQVLTKRPGRMRSLMRSDAFRERAYLASNLDTGELHGDRWPLPNVWLGVSVEDQKRAELRIPALLDTPATVRFLSCEPLLGPVDLLPGDHTGHEREWYGSDYICVDCSTDEELVIYRRVTFPAIDWVIAGGESGSGARPVDPSWIRTLRDQCVANEVPFLFKQWGQWAPDGDHPDMTINHSMVLCRSKKEAGRVLDGRTWDQFPTETR
jgi:protein gp37